MIKLEFTLLQKTFLRDLSDDQIKALEDCAYVVQAKTGEFVFERGREATRFFLIESGQVNLELYTREHGPQIIQSLKAGEFFGTSWMIPPFQWKTDARAAVDSSLIVFNASKTKELCEKDQGLGYALMRCFFVALSQRLEASQNKILRLSIKND